MSLDINSSKWAVSWQNQQNDLCAQQWSAWASAQSDQSLYSVLIG